MSRGVESRTKGWRDSRDRIEHEAEGSTLTAQEKEAAKAHKAKVTAYDESRLDVQMGMKVAFESILRNPTLNHVSNMLSEIIGLAQRYLKEHDPSLQKEVGWSKVKVEVKIHTKYYQVCDLDIKVDEQAIDGAWDALFDWGQSGIRRSPKPLYGVMASLDRFIRKHQVSPHGEQVALNFDSLGAASKALRDLCIMLESPPEVPIPDEASGLLRAAKAHIRDFLMREVRAGKAQTLACKFSSLEDADKFASESATHGRKLSKTHSRTAYLYGSEVNEFQNTSEDVARNRLLDDMKLSLSGILNIQSESHFSHCLECLKEGAIEYAGLFDSKSEYRKLYDTHTKEVKVVRVWSTPSKSKDLS